MHPNKRHEVSPHPSPKLHYHIWGPFSKVPTLFGRLSGDIVLCIFKAKASRNTKLCTYFNFYPVYKRMKRPTLQNRRVAVLGMAFRARKGFGCFKKRAPGARFSKIPRTFRARKANRKITTCLFCKADLFTCCKGNKNKDNGKVSCLEAPSF